MDENLDSWDPMEEDFRDPSLSTYSNKGPAKHYSRNGFKNGIGHQANVSLYIRNVPLNYSDASMKNLLGKYGTVLSSHVMKPNEKSYITQTVVGMAKVETMRDALNIIEKMNKKPPLNLSIELAKSEGRIIKHVNMDSFSKKFPANPASHENLEIPYKEDCHSKDTGKEEVPKPNIDITKQKAPISNNIEISHSKRPSPCVRCNLTGLKRCSICKAFYCSKTCQVDDWYYHKDKCSPPPPLEDYKLMENESFDLISPINKISSKDESLKISEDNVGKETTRETKSPSLFAHLSRIKSANDVIETRDKKKESVNKKAENVEIGSKSFYGKEDHIVKQEEEIEVSCQMKEQEECPKENNNSFLESKSRAVKQSHSSNFSFSKLGKTLLVPHSLPRVAEGNRNSPVESDLNENKNSVEKSSVGDRLLTHFKSTPKNKSNAFPIEEKRKTTSRLESCSTNSENVKVSTSALSLNTHVKFKNGIEMKEINERRYRKLNAPHNSEITNKTSLSIVSNSCEVENKKTKSDRINKNCEEMKNSDNKGTINVVSNDVSNNKTKMILNITSSLEESKIYKGLVTELNSVTKFSFMLLNERTAELCNISAEEFSTGEQLFIGEVKCNDIVMAQSTADELWYRAIVCNILSENVVKVCYIDYGNKEEVQNLRKIPQFIQKLAFPGFGCHAYLKQVLNGNLAILKQQIELDCCFEFKVAKKTETNLHVLILSKDNEPLAEYIVRSSSDNEQNESESYQNSSEIEKSLSRKFFKNDLKYPSVEPGKQYDAIPSWYEDGILYVQLLSDQKKILEITETLNEQCPKDNSQATPLTRGEIVSAFVRDDGIWYRGEVLEAKETEVHLYFTDFGNKDFISKEEIRPFIPCLIDIPVLALPVLPITNCKKEVLQDISQSIVDESSPVVIIIKDLNPLKAFVKDTSGKRFIYPDVPKKTNTDASPSESVMDLLKKGAAKPMLLMYDECKTTSLPIKKNVEVVILKPSNPLNIFVTSKENLPLYEELERLSTKINQYCNSLITTYYKPKEGEVCLAKYEEGVWHRAACITTSNFSAILFFVDSGNYDELPFENICQMVDVFLDIPLLVVHCKLQGITQDDVEEGGSTLASKFSEILPPFSEVIVNVLSKSEDSEVYTIEIPLVDVDELKKIK